MARMKQTELLDALAEATNTNRKTAKSFIESFVGIAYKEAATNDKGFAIPNIGILMLKDRPARMARNPRTGEQVKVAAKRVVKFRVSKQCKEAVVDLAPKKKKVVEVAKTKKKKVDDKKVTTKKKLKKK